MPNSTQNAAAFVRGFFIFLEYRQVRSAVLHGGADGFERELSDVDFVVNDQAFSQLPQLIDEYCAQAGWQLCQILRHETTAAFCVCSALDDPTCVVALDACSDYQRNDTLFLKAKSLLRDRTELPWGGFRLSDPAELCYRFAKAAAKGKDPVAATAEFSHYPEGSRSECAAWLKQEWGISCESWDEGSLSLALAQLRTKCNSRPSLLHSGTLGRILSRILQPTGLIVITGHADFDATAARLESVFSHLYFRSFKKIRRWQSAMFKDLVASTLIVVPELGTLWSKLLPEDCVYRMAAGEDCRVIASHLFLRCKQRETR